MNPLEQTKEEENWLTPTQEEACRAIYEFIVKNKTTYKIVQQRCSGLTTILKELDKRLDKIRPKEEL